MTSVIHISISIQCIGFHLSHNTKSNDKNDFYMISMRDVDAIKEHIACD